MSSDSTEYYNFPQYKVNDHPDFLGEINDAYKTIDGELYKLNTETIANKEELASIKDSVIRLQHAVEELLSTAVVQKGDI